MKLNAFIGIAILSSIIFASVPLYAQQEKHGDKQDRPQQQQTKAEPGKPAHQRAQAQKTQRPAQHAEQRQDNRQSQHTSQQQQAKHDQVNPSMQHARQQREGTQKGEPAQQAQTGRQQDQHNRSPHIQQGQKVEDRAEQPSARQHGHESARRTPEQQRMQHTAWHQHGSQHWESEHRTWQQRGGYRGYRIPQARFRGYFGQEHGFRISGLPFLVVGGFPRFQYRGYWISTVDPWPEYWGDEWYDNDDVYVNYVDNGYYLYNRRYPNVGIAINISM
ncbi:MAG: hypothetical protein JWQ87_1047 [Candidatus Sulfotelmatobacter sp.]|nr:hypothetical protein [Candidatus Sulfotelmatobacter sp.]